jgi:hypothetical protein
MSAAAGVMKPEYGPSVPRLLAPRWRAASGPAKAAATAAAVALVALLLAAGLTLENAAYSHGGNAPFSFEYRGLYRTTPDRGEYMKAVSRWPDGSLKYEFAVGPLALPRYRDEVSAELALYATGFIRSLREEYPKFSLRAEGKTKINNTLTGYEVAFFTDVEGREMYARDVLLTPPEAHPREGVLVTMLTAPGASSQVGSPLEVGETGVLLRPLKSFAFG